jgi:hypothetical protein
MAELKLGPPNGENFQIRAVPVFSNMPEGQAQVEDAKLDGWERDACILSAAEEQDWTPCVRFLIGSLSEILEG